MRMILLALVLTLTGCVETYYEADDDDSAVEVVEVVDSATCVAICRYLDKCGIQDEDECLEMHTEGGNCPVECPEADEQDVCLEGVRTLSCDHIEDGSWPEEIDSYCDIPIC